MVGDRVTPEALRAVVLTFLTLIPQELPSKTVINPSSFKNGKYEKMKMMYFVLFSSFFQDILKKIAIHWLLKH